MRQTLINLSSLLQLASPQNLNANRLVQSKSAMNFSADTVAETLPCEAAHGKHPHLLRDRASDGGSKKDKHYWCRLCQRGGLRDDCAIQSHFKEAVHKANVRTLTTDHDTMRKILNRSSRLLSKPLHAEILSKVNRMQSQHWKNTAQAELFRYVFAEDDPEHGLLDAPRQTLKRYEALQRCVLLHLAAWKAECLQQMPNVGTDFLPPTSG
jgi:hypothetical protein